MTIGYCAREGQNMLNENIFRTLVVAAVAFASHSSAANHANVAAGSDIDYASVEHVKMLTRIVSVPVAREECWEEPVTQFQPAPARAHSYTSTIVGGIVGAVVGNQFGSGSGRDWATVAGTTLGASIGSDYNRRRAASAGTTVTTNERRCRVVNDFQQEERADGYLVTYTYNGRQYETQTPNHPGDRIKVRLAVTPVE